VSYRLDPNQPLGTELRRIALGCIDDALDRLTSLDGTDADAIATAVHETRKRCKETRGLARLIGEADVNAEMRDAAKELSALRDSHALLGAIDDLRDSLSEKKASRLDAVRTRQAAVVHEIAAQLTTDDPRIGRAIERLRAARVLVEAWSLPDGTDMLAAGLERSYGRGRKDLKASLKKPDDQKVHQWRKRAKDLWYQTRLLGSDEEVARLDELSDLLGGDHDLTVLVEDLSDADDTLDERTIRRAVRLARDHQSDLRLAAFRLGRQIYDDDVDAFVARVLGGFAAGPAGPEGMVERERKWLVARRPELADDGVRMAQGYVAIDGNVALRVRDAGPKGRTMTLKGGTGAVRTELEWKIGIERFDAAWALTAGRTVEKTRYRIPVGNHTAELDVFEGRLAGLLLVEVEFDDEGALALFEAPDWFGDEVTDDGRYTNAALAVDGLPD
jgi:CYTH domain-containing protein